MAVIRLGNLLWKDNTQPNSVSNPVNTKDVNSDAIKNKVDTLATEATLEQVRALLSGVATENKLEQARTLLDAISTKDFATSSKQDALNIAVEDLKNELILVKSELETIKANQLSGDQKVQLSGTIEIIDVPFDGVLYPRVNEVETIESDTIDVSHLKNIQIFMMNGVKTDEPSSISVLISPASSPWWCIFYDWNREDWVTSGLVDGGTYSIPFTTVKVPYTALPGSLFNLTTHPDLYWVKEYKGKVLQIRFKTNSLPESGRTNSIRVWVVGERL